MEEWLQHLTDFIESRDTMSSEEWKQALADGNYKDDTELEADFKRAEKEVNKRRKKDGLEVEEQEEEEPTFPLVDTPDDQVSVALFDNVRSNCSYLSVLFSWTKKV